MLRRKRSATKLMFLPLVASVLASTSAIGLAATSADQIPSLIQETSAHFQLSYRMHPNEARDRQSQLDAAVAAWRAAPRSAASDELLATWLRSAIRSSMPGQRDVLPPIPEFKTVTRIHKPVGASAPVDRSLAAPLETPMPPSRIGEQVKEFPATPPTLEMPAASQPTTAATNHADQSPVDEGPAASDEMTDPFRDDPIEQSPEE